MRRMLAIAAMLMLVALVAVVLADGNFSNPPPIPIDDNNVQQTTDTLCACVADTIKGPSLVVFGAESAYLGVQASAGGCSLVVAQVSHNNQVWLPAATYTEVIQYPTYAVFDSLNQGGVTVALLPRLAGALTTPKGMLIPFQYARLCLIRRTGYTTTTASAGPTVACRSFLRDPLFNGYAHFPAKQ